MAGLEVRRHKGTIWRLWASRDGTARGDELVVANRFLAGALLGDATLTALIPPERIFVQVFVPPATPVPYLCAFYQSTAVVLTQYGPGARTACLQYVIQAVDQVDPARDYSDAMLDALDRVTVLLDTAPGPFAVTGGEVSQVEWGGPWAAEETPA